MTKTTAAAASADSIARALGFTRFSDLMKQNERLVCSEVRKYCRSNPADFEDMLQEVWLKVSQRISQFAGNSKVSTWLHVVARNTCLSYLEKQGNSHRLKGMLCYEHESGASSGDSDESFNLEELGTGRSYAPSPEEELIAKQTAWRLNKEGASMFKSRREAGAATMLDLRGFDALSEMVGNVESRIVDNSADFIAEVLLMGLNLPEAELLKAWEALTLELGGADNEATFTFERLIELSAAYGFAPDLSVNQIAKLLDRSNENVRVHNSRGAEDVIQRGAPDFYAEILAHRASKRANAKPRTRAQVQVEEEVESV